LGDCSHALIREEQGQKQASNQLVWAGQEQEARGRYRVDALYDTLQSTILALAYSCCYSLHISPHVSLSLVIHLSYSCCYSLHISPHVSLSLVIHLSASQFILSASQPVSFTHSLWNHQRRS